MLTTDQRSSWERDGYLILPGFYTPDAMEGLDAGAAALHRAPPEWLVASNTVTGRRGRLGDFPAEERTAGHLRLNDLYRHCEEVRAVALDPRLRAILRQLLGEPTVLCSSLTFEKGSQQTEHIDSLYLTPPTPGHLVAAWVAVEDAHPDAGQLFFYPGSHHIRLYTFGDGGYRAVPQEMGEWMRYITEQLSEGGLARQTFAAKRGDLFLWAANLVHGGSPIADPTRTRKSLVCHYLTRSDATTLGFDCVAAGEDAFWTGARRTDSQRPHSPSR